MVTDTEGWVLRGVFPVGWITCILISDPDEVVGGTGARYCRLEVSSSTTSGDTTNIFEAIDVGAEFPTARVLDGGGDGDSSFDRTTLLILLFREIEEEESQEEHFQSFGWNLDLRLF